MAVYSTTDVKLCWLGKTAQKLGCLPSKFATTTQVFYPMAIQAADSDDRYSIDIKYKPGPRLPPPQPDEPKPQMILYTPTPTYQHKSPRVPKSPKKTPVAQTVPLSTLQLPVNALPTPRGTCATLNANLPPDHHIVQSTPISYLTPISAIPRTPHQNTFPDSILQDLRNIAPTHLTWDTQHGTLTYTPSPASHLPLPNPLVNYSPSSPRFVDVGSGNGEPMGLGLLPSPISSDSSDSSSDCTAFDHRFGVTLHPLIALNPLEGNLIDWHVSDPARMARHVEDDDTFLANANQSATTPPTHTLHIDICFLDQPGVRWNWEPITINKRRSIRITDILHSIHDYFQTQLTHAEYDAIKSHGKRNSRIVANSFRERVTLQPSTDMRDEAYHGGLRRVDCLGSCKIFAGLWVEGLQLTLGLRQ